MTYCMSLRNWYMYILLIITQNIEKEQIWGNGTKTAPNQKGCSSYLIIILYIVFLFFIIIPTLSQLTYFFQVKWRHYSAETLQDIAQSVTDSSRNNHNIPQLVQEEGCPVKLYDWKTFLKQFLSHFHHSQPIIIFVLIKNNLELSLSKSTATLWKRNSGCKRNEQLQTCLCHLSYQGKVQML